jgi:two-component system response regulator RegA
MARILVVDDDDLVCRAIELVLASEGRHEVRAAARPSQAGRLLEEWKPDLLLLDLGFPGESGESWLADLRQGSAVVRVVVLSTFDDAPTAVRLFKLGVQDYLVKPVQGHHLRHVLERALGIQTSTGYRGRSSVDDQQELVWPSTLPTMADFTTALIDEAIRRCNGNISAAARILGISRQALSKRLKHLRTNSRPTLAPQLSPRTPGVIPARPAAVVD